MSRGHRKGLLLSVCLLILILAGSLYLFYRFSLKPVSDRKGSTELVIYEGEETSEVLRQLEQDDLIHSRLTAQIYAWIHGKEALYAGTFEIPQDLSVAEIFDYINDPSHIEQAYEIITIPEGTWARDIAATLSEHFPHFSAQQFLDLWNDDQYIKELSETYTFLDPDQIDPDSFVKLEGYLFPETYYFDKDADPQEITQMFLDGFDTVYQSLSSEIRKNPLSLQEILTLASIVQFEAGEPEDMAGVAEVFLNRMEVGMKLESSVTVCYALYDQYKSYQDCEMNPDVDSPYNTYLVSGLPSGPILNPGREAIVAVLEPADHDYLFFVADIYGDGAIHYAKTYEEHLQNIEKYHLNIGTEENS